MLTVNQAEAVAILSGVNSRQIAQIKRDIYPDYNLATDPAAEFAAVAERRAKALLAAAGQGEDMTVAEVQAMLAMAWAQAKDDGAQALRWANATNLMNEP